MKFYVSDIPNDAKYIRLIFFLGSTETLKKNLLAEMLELLGRSGSLTGKSPKLAHQLLGFEPG